MKYKMTLTAICEFDDIRDMRAIQQGLGIMGMDHISLESLLQSGKEHTECADYPSAMIRTTIKMEEINDADDRVPNR